MEHVEEEMIHLVANRKQRMKKGLETKCNIQGHGTCDLLPPFSPHLQKFHNLQKYSYHVGTNLDLVQYMSLWVTFHIKTII
jgi:hypothetical protein